MVTVQSDRPYVQAAVKVQTFDSTEDLTTRISAAMK